MDFAALFADIPIIAYVLFAIGVLLLCAEMATPGFGVAGASSFVAFIAAIVFAADTLVEGLVFSGIVLVVSAIIIVTFFILLAKGKIAGGFILKAATTADAGFSSAARDLSHLIGAAGVSATTLRPAGRANIGDTTYDVVSSGSFIAAGVAIRVLEVIGNRIVVEKV